MIGLLTLLFRQTGNVVRSYKMNVTEAKYMEYNGQTVNIRAVIDGIVRFVPISTDNLEYRIIQEKVADGTLTIADAD